MLKLLKEIYHRTRQWHIVNKLLKKKDTPIFLRGIAKQNIIVINVSVLLLNS